MSSVLAMQLLCPDCRASLTPGIHTVRAAIQNREDSAQPYADLTRREYSYTGMTLAGMLRLLGEGLFLVMALLYTAMAVHLVSAARGKNWQLMASVELWSAADIFFL
jgi:hypothetical protein